MTPPSRINVLGVGVHALLLDQARILEGEPVPDTKAFTRRLSAVMAKGF